MKSQHLKVFFVWFAHTPLSTSLMDGKISSSRLSANMIWEYKPNLDPELGQDKLSTLGITAYCKTHILSLNIESGLNRAEVKMVLTPYKLQY